MNMKARWALSALGVFLVMLLAACVPAVNFNDFIGVNLIKTDGDLSQWTADQSATYMTLAPAGGGLTFTDGSPAYRLEIRNLFKNGDFETSTVGTAPTGWTDMSTGIADAYSVEANDNFSGATTIDGNSLFFSVNSGNRISYDLAAGSEDGMVAGITYLIRFQFFITTTEFELSYNDNATDIYSWNISGISARVTPFPPPWQPDSTFIAGQGPSHYFSINSIATSTAHAGYIDDIRLTRIDVPCRISFQVPFSRTGRPNLIPGTYRFSFSVKADPSVTPAVPNRFPANGVSFAVDGLTNGIFTYSIQPVVKHPTDAGADWSQWTEFSSDFVEPSIPDKSAPDAKMLILSITSTDVSGGALTEDVGSVLIANPRLEFIPSP